MEKLTESMVITLRALDGNKLTKNEISNITGQTYNAVDHAIRRINKILKPRGFKIIGEGKHATVHKYYMNTNLENVLKTFNYVKTKQITKIHFSIFHSLPYT